MPLRLSQLGHELPFRLVRPMSALSNSGPPGKDERILHRYKTAFAANHLDCGPSHFTERGWLGPTCVAYLVARRADEPFPHRNDSITRSIAGCFRFFLTF